MSSPLKQNTTTIQELLNTINALPDAGGVEFPELSNEGSAAELFAGKELIDGNGEKVTGTFTIDNELTTQDNLISQIQTALQNKASASEPVLQTKTVTPTTSAQNVTPDSGYDGLSKVTVNAIPSTYVAPTTTKAATTYTPTTSNQTIAAGTYCSGVQTIKGDANLKAENIAEGVSIFGVTGSHSGSGSGGGSVEVYSGKISFAMLPSPLTVTYTDNTLNYTTVNIDSLTNINVVKNTIVFITGSICNAISGCTRLGGGTGSYAYLITANNFEIQTTL